MRAYYDRWSESHEPAPGVDLSGNRARSFTNAMLECYGTIGFVEKRFDLLGSGAQHLENGSKITTCDSAHTRGRAGQRKLAMMMDPRG
jgi:hypothetical protein